MESQWVSFQRSHAVIIIKVFNSERPPSDRYSLFCTYFLIIVQLVLCLRPPAGWSMETQIFPPQPLHSLHVGNVPVRLGSGSISLTKGSRIREAQKHADPAPDPDPQH